MRKKRRIWKSSKMKKRGSLTAGERKGKRKNRRYSSSTIEGGGSVTEERGKGKTLRLEKKNFAEEDPPGQRKVESLEGEEKQPSPS